MNYEQKYKEALGWMQSLYKGLHGATKEDAEHYFPELKESEGERIRKEIVDFITSSNKYGTNEICEAWLNWLEKQGEQTKERFTWKPSKEQIAALRWVLNNVPYNKHKEEINGLLDQIKDIPQKDFSPIEPKFKVSDWLQYRYAEPFLVEEITEQGYCNGNSCLPFEWEDEIHLWTIQDAKDGDVLATEDGRPFIIRCMVESKNDIPSAYCGINARPIEAFIITGYSPGTSKWTNSKVHPATKEQRDLLFQKMKEAGYEWDTEKKEVKKIEPKTLNADEVIEWLDKNADLFDAKWCYTKNIIEQLKQDFKL